VRYHLGRVESRETHDCIYVLLVHFLVIPGIRAFLRAALGLVVVRLRYDLNSSNLNIWREEIKGRLLLDCIDAIVIYMCIYAHIK
jgi:glucose uptake protein GlcU